MPIETTTRTITALELLCIWSSTTIDAANKMRDECETEEDVARAAPIVDRFMGKAEGYNDAYVLMKKELRRLLDLHRNGVLTTGDFGDIG